MPCPIYANPPTPNVKPQTIFLTTSLLDITPFNDQLLWFLCPILYYIYSCCLETDPPWKWRVPPRSHLQALQRRPETSRRSVSKDKGWTGCVFCTGLDTTKHYVCVVGAIRSEHRRSTNTLSYNHFPDLVCLQHFPGDSLALFCMMNRQNVR